MYQVNKFLREYFMWEKKLDAAILVGLEDYEQVCKWRKEMEEERRKIYQGEETTLELKQFCQTFTPSYKAYGPNLKTKGIEVVDEERTLSFRLNGNRVPYVGMEEPL